MKNNFKFKKLIFVAALIFCQLVSFVNVSAETADDKGSIHVNLNDLGTDFDGVKLTCYKVGVPLESNAVEWALTEEFASSDVVFNSLETASDNINAASKLSAMAKENNVAGITAEADENGVVKFENLDMGIYLIVQTDSAKYGLVNSFLVSVPYENAEGNWVMDVETQTKGEHFAPTPPPPQTGQESSNNTLLIFICGVSVILIGIMIFAGKREKEK